MITVQEVKALFVTAEACGCRPPEALSDPDAFQAAASLYADVLVMAGLDAATAKAALAAYLAEPNVSGYPKAWPDPGVLVGRTPGARLRAASLGLAATLFDRVIRCRSCEGPDCEDDWYTDRMGYLPTSDEAKAIHLAVGVLGGWKALGLIEQRELDAKRRVFASAYEGALAAMPVRHADPVLPLGGPSAQPMLTGATRPAIQ